VNSKRLRFELFVTNVQKSIDFYQSVFGLSPPPSYSPDDYVPVSDDLVTIGLQHFASLPPQHHFRQSSNRVAKGVGVEIVIEVDNIDNTYKKAQVTVGHFGGQIEPLQARPWGRTDFRIIDPDGYYIRVST
jgi:lactoylglutathione lyase